ncbi:MAG TPA: amidohydrolase family protein [Vicinamibacterales bacterium]|nr:amidohydrolase family protein [Vicinamibacterales bacterium]
MSERIFLSGASLVLPGRIVSDHTLVIEAGRIIDMVASPSAGGRTDVHFHLPAHYVLPGFIDVHVHGLEGHDVLDSAEGMATVAAALPRFGVTAFCPTSLACSPDVLDGFLDTVSGLRRLRRPVDARVIGAHVESNFISAQYRGAQPAACLRAADAAAPPPEGAEGSFTGADVIAVLDRHRPDVGVVTLAPEVPGALALTRRLASGGTRVSLGHSAATFEIANDAISAGARHATHLFNRMPPMTHYAPGLAGAVLATDAVAAELICDGSHVHPAFVQMAIAAKGVSHIMAITDGTAGSGLPRGSRARIGGQSITVGDVARLDDGTTAGSVATMDSVLRYLTGPCGLDLCDAAQLCATTPARELGLIGYGAIAAGGTADLVVLDAGLNVVQTWIGGALAWAGTSVGPESSPSS